MRVLIFFVLLRMLVSTAALLSSKATNSPTIYHVLNNKIPDRLLPILGFERDLFYGVYPSEYTKFTGKWHQWDECGKLSRIVTLSNGLRDGETQVFRSDGSLAQIIIYEKGRIIRIDCYVDVNHRFPIN